MDGDGGRLILSGSEDCKCQEIMEPTHRHFDHWNRATYGAGDYLQ